MKTKIKFPEYLAGVLFFLSFLLPAQVKAQYEDVSLETFYDELSPYGVWINDPQYGNVWRPDVDQDDFRPYYTNGHWEMTKYGNTWVSDYEWGWAPFHYGRWHHSSRRGWIWVPDTRWGPAWVSWRSGGGHYGWAPLGPGININIGSRIPDYYWVFVPQRNIYYDRYPRYDRYRNRNIYSNTVIINNTYVYNQNRYYTGPRVDEIRRVTRQPVRIHDVRDNRPTNYGNNRSDRPQVNRSGNPAQNPRPNRPTDNSGGRGAVTGSGSNPVADNSVNRGAVRPDSRQIPASTQRSDRTYDNQDIRGSQSNQGGQRPPITDRQEAPAQAPREQRPERVTQAPRQHQAPERIQRSEPQQRQAPSQERIQRSEPQQRRYPAPERVQRSEPQQRQAPSPERIQRSAPQDRQAPSQSRQSSEVRDNSSSGQENGRGGQNRPSRGN